jgi:sortase A
MRLSRVVGAVGKVLITIGVLLLLFVAYQLWGTGLHEEEAQSRLRHQYDQLVGPADAATTPTTSVAGDPPVTLPAEVGRKRDLAPNIGDVVGRIEIPKLHVKKIVVQGVSLEQLDEAPGHYPQTPFPGQAGNAAIAGHRTTYGAPFSNVDKLKKGDLILITTVQGSFRYEVQRVFIVEPSDVWVLKKDKKYPNALTLTACHPKLDASQRIIVRASLVGKPVPKLQGQDAATARQILAGNALNENTGWWAPSARIPALLWGLACAGVWLLAWLLSRAMRRFRWVPYAAGLPIFLVLLFVFFEHATKLMPAGF